MSVNLVRPTISYVDTTVLDSVMETMLANDTKLVPEQTVAPRLWKCGWYNQQSAPKYDRGDAVWLNTESVDDVVASNYDYILSIVEGNSELRYMYDDVKDDEQKTFSFFKKVVTGEVTGNSAGLPLFYVGDIAKPTSIRVSLSAGNDKLPTDDAYWKDFFVDNRADAETQILECAAETIRDSMDRHLSEYHLSGLSWFLYDESAQVQHTLDDYYARTDMSNVSGQQQHAGTKESSVQSGFDYVVAYHHKRFQDNVCKWFRVWNSGMVEHGGILLADVRHAVSAGDSMTYGGADGKFTCYKVNFGWTDGDIQAPIYAYGTNAGGFHLLDQKIDLGDGFGIHMDGISRSVNASDRYTVQLTPAANNTHPYSTIRPNDGLQGYYYTNKEVLSMKNDSFCFITTPGHGRYSYHVVGFVPNIQQRYK